MARFLALFLLTLCPTLLMATSLVPGFYAYQADMGSLTLSRGPAGNMRFEIQTQSSGGHNCYAAGTVKGTLGISDTSSEKACHIPFTQINARDVRVGFNFDIHMCFCGTNASFEGLFRMPPKTCTKDAQHKRRALARASYAKKDYLGAQRRLAALLKECRPFMDSGEDDAITNEIALSQYHQGNPQACLKTLSQTLAWESTCADDLYVGAGVKDAYLKTAEKIWFNRRLCKNALKKTH